MRPSKFKPSTFFPFLDKGQEVIIIGNHPHTGEKCTYVCADNTIACGWGAKFKNEWNEMFYVFNSNNLDLKQ